MLPGAIRPPGAAAPLGPAQADAAVLDQALAQALGALLAGALLLLAEALLLLGADLLVLVLLAPPRDPPPLGRCSAGGPWRGPSPGAEGPTAGIS